ncbi:FolB Dihydroneopterin aldolase [Burkholderiales bacterium]
MMRPMTQTAGHRRVFLNELSLMASIGFHDFERAARQRILVNVDLFVPLEQAQSHRDDVADLLDYDRVRAGIQALVAARHYNLQETLVDEILALCLEFPQVSGARVSTQKPDVYPDCKTVGIETEAWRS